MKARHDQNRQRWLLQICKLLTVTIASLPACNSYCSPWPEIETMFEELSKMQGLKPRKVAVPPYFLAQSTNDSGEGLAFDKADRSGGFEDYQLEEDLVYDYLNRLEPKFNEQCHKVQVAAWNYNTNMTDKNKQIMVDADAAAALFEREAHFCLKSYFNETTGMFANWKKYRDPMLVRRIEKTIGILGNAALSEDEYAKLTALQNEMEKVFSKARICLPSGKCGLPLDPEIVDLTAKSRDYDLLTHIWKAWRDASGRKIRQYYIPFVNMVNKAAHKNGFGDASLMWTVRYDTPSFKEEVDKAWQELAPLYKKLHAYIRVKLSEVYGHLVDRTGPIPAHILGNPWAQSWIHLSDIALPHPKVPTVDITPALKKQGFDVVRMFKTAEDFFLSLGFMPMTKKFWVKSMLEQPPDRKVVCHASAWDFCLGPGNDDFRIKMCSEVTHQDFVTIHHEMGHIQYYMEYKDHPAAFRAGANPGFHEAVGDTISLAVSTPKHLKKLKLLPELRRSNKTRRDPVATELNSLMTMALDKIAFLPYAYLVDRWRWDIFSGKVSAKRLNGHWWKLREEIQGVKAPVPRSELDFDAGGKYHVPAHVPYIRYFVSYIIQFQLYEALCEAAGEYEVDNPKKPLHQCDFYESQKAGQMFREALRLGASVPWPEVMEKITGQRKMSAASLRTYFAPLERYLDEFLRTTGDCVGWGDDCLKKSYK